MSEQAVISTMLINKGVISKVRANLKPENFHDPANRCLFEVISEMIDRGLISNDGGATFDLEALHGFLVQGKRLKEAGGFEYMATLVEKASTSAAIDYHIKKLKSKPVSKNQPKRANRGPTMADLREYVDLQIEGGVNFTSDDICKAMGAYSREHRVIIYNYLLRLTEEKIIKKDSYRHGGYKKIQTINAYDMGGAIENRTFEINLPLDLQNLIKIEPDHLISIAGTTDAGKSAFLYHVMKLNYQTYSIIHFSSPEWGTDAIKKRMDDIGIERPHPNVTCYPMELGYEDLIPPKPCIVLVDYLRTNEQFNELDRQYHAILKNLKGGVAFTAIQKHIGKDKPTGGQYAIHAAHHVILLDPWKDLFICKIFKTKNERPLRGYYRIFNYKDLLLKPISKEWKKGEIRWEKELNRNDNNDNNDNKKADINPSPPYINKEKEKEKRTKKEREKEKPKSTARENNQKGLFESTSLEGEI